MMRKNRILRLCLALLITLIFSISAMAQERADKVKIGQVTVVLQGPEGLSRVDGCTPGADAFIKKLESKFKLRILAVYADKNNWDKFNKEVQKGQAASIPRLAMICAPKKMANKSYNVNTTRKEFKSYVNWFGVATNNRPLAAILTGQANSKLKEATGVNLNFKYKIGAYTKKIAESSNSISLAAQVSFTVNGKVTGGILTATSLAVGDKLIFTGDFEEASSNEKRDEIIARSIQWRGRLNAAR